jgi:thioredoxin reductase (NADPH)
MPTRQAAIIGAGPAGLAAAIQLKRSGIEAWLFEGGRMGGLLWNANLVENYPGFAGGIPGPELAGRFIEQAKHLKIEVIQDRIFYEVFPLLDRKGCQIAIIGAGDAAFDYALNLAGENEVIILSRGEAASCLPLLRERAAACPGILYHPSTRISRLEPSETGKVRVTGVQAHQEFDIQVDMVLCATGREAQLDFMPAMAQGEVERLEKDGCLTFIGDVKNGLYRQAAIAVGDGIYAGMKIFQQLKETEL